MKGAVVTTGFFDGVHIGHAKVIGALAGAARQRGVRSLVVTFAQSPSVALGKTERIGLLSDVQQKSDLLRSLGADAVEVLEFSREFAAKSASQYIDFLKEQYGACCLVLGYDNRIGCDRKGCAEIEGIGTVCVPPCIVQGSPVSSTRIREALSRGEVEAATAFLGRPYGIRAEVVGGKRLGRSIGFPTANLGKTPQAVPASGVYGGTAFFDGISHPAMINVSRSSLVEAHLPAFSGDLYGKTLEIRFERRIRQEMEFSGPDELRAQLLRDLESF